MKKSILLVAAIFSVAVLFTSCKESKKEEVKTESHEGHGHDVDSKMASADAFQCPMDCEKGKSYDKEGACPVCKMDLKKQSADKDGLHVEGCTCKDGGECTCEPGACKCMAKSDEAKKCEKCEDGKCTCKAETAAVAKDCDHCEPGQCTCEGKEVAEKAMECSKCEPGACECKA